MPVERTPALLQCRAVPLQSRVVPLSQLGLRSAHQRVREWIARNSFVRGLYGLVVQERCVFLNAFSALAVYGCDVCTGEKGVAMYRVKISLSLNGRLYYQPEGKVLGIDF